MAKAGAKTASAAKPAADPMGEVRALLRRRAEDLLDWEISHRATFEHYAALKAECRALVNKLGVSVKLPFDGKGLVTGSAGHPKEYQGEVPEVDIDGFHDLTEARRARLLSDWPVKMIEKWKKAVGPRIDTDLFLQPPAVHAPASR